MPTSNAKTTEPQGPLVYPPRHPAEVLTGCRLQAAAAGEAVVHVPLPGDVAPSLAHLAVAIDIAAGQAAGHCLPHSTNALRTLSLNAQLTAALTPGSWLYACGRSRSYQGQSIVTTCEVFDSAGALMALGSCRFMVVEAQRRGRSEFSTESLDLAAVQASWDSALGLGDPALHSVGNTAEPLTLRSAAPGPATDNGASMVHGGVQVRALELAMHSALGSASQRSQTVLSDVAVVFHRPVPIGSGAGIYTRSAVRRRGRRVAVGEASFVGPDQKLLSTAEGIFTAM